MPQKNYKSSSMNVLKLRDKTLIHRNQLHFYILTTNHQKEKLGNSLTYHIKKKKYLGINLVKEVKDLYSEIYKKLMKEMEDDTNR